VESYRSFGEAVAVRRIGRPRPVAVRRIDRLRPVAVRRIGRSRPVAVRRIGRPRPVAERMIGRPGPVAVRTIGIPRIRWEVEVRVDLGKIKIRNWGKMGMEREASKRTADQARTHKEL
jgi:hypothetical protein